MATARSIFQVQQCYLNVFQSRFWVWIGVYMYKFNIISNKFDFNRWLKKVHTPWHTSLTLKRPAGVPRDPSHVSSWAIFGLFIFFKNGLVNLLLVYCSMFLDKQKHLCLQGKFFNFKFLVGVPWDPIRFIAYIVMSYALSTIVGLCFQFMINAVTITTNVACNSLPLQQLQLVLC